MRGDRDNDSRFGSRMQGQRVWADMLRERFVKATQRLGLNRNRHQLDLTQFSQPATSEQPGQMALF